MHADVLANWVPLPDTIPTFSPNYHPGGQQLLLSPAQLRRQRSTDMAGWSGDPDDAGARGHASEGGSQQEPSSTFLTEVGPEAEGAPPPRPRLSLFEWHAEMKKSVQRDIK